MKRMFSVFLAILLCFSYTSDVIAAPSDTTLHFNLTADNLNEITVPSGTDITVKLFIENATVDAAFPIQSFSDVLEFDKDFFELKTKTFVFEESIKGASPMIQLKYGSGNIPYIQVNDRHNPPKDFLSKQLVASFTMTVKATSGTGYVKHVDMAAKTDNGVYGEKSTDLKVTVADSTDTGGGNTGGTVSNPKYTLTFQNTDLDPIKAKKGSVIDLTKSEYTPAKSGFHFLGWYEDEACTKKITEVVLNKEQTAVYAKWEKTSTGTGTSVTKYTLNFEENGGSIVKDTTKVRNTTVDLSKYITKREGYSFDGWHTDKALTEKVTFLKMTKNTTLYAKWVEGDNGYEDKPNYKPDIFTSEHNAYIVGREGGYIDPNANLTRAEAATLFFRLLDAQVLLEGMTKENAFTDVNKGDWFNTAVSTLANLEVLNGRTKDSFAPNATITRAEFMTIVARLSEAEYNGDIIFSDTIGHWAKEYINIAASIQWANGDNGLFRPNDNVTRAEAMTIVNRATNRLPENVSDLLDGMVTFKDNADTGAWYYLNIQEATNSHDYKMKEDGIHETWTTLKKSPNWAEFEQ